MSHKVSVLFPVYNSSLYLKDSLYSLLQQHYKNIEIIAINDGSTDNSLSILQDANDSRIRIVNNKKNMGLIYTLNKGLKYCTGDYIARMDSDDIAHRNRIAVQVSFLSRRKDVDLCGTYMKCIGSQNHVVKYPVLHDDIKVRLLFCNSIAHPTVMFRKELYTCGDFTYDSELLSAEDYGLWVKLANHYTFENIPKVLHYYRIHRDNLSKRLDVATLHLIQRNALDNASMSIDENILFSLNLLGRNIEFGESPKADLTVILRTLKILKVSASFSRKSFEVYVYKRWLRLCLLAGKNGVNTTSIFSKYPLKKFCMYPIHFIIVLIFSLLKIKV